MLQPGRPAARPAGRGAGTATIRPPSAVGRPTANDSAPPWPPATTSSAGGASGSGSGLGSVGPRHQRPAQLGGRGALGPDRPDRPPRRPGRAGPARPVPRSDRPMRARSEPSGGVGGVGHHAGDRLDEHQGQGVDVAAPVERAAGRLLGRDVAGGAQHDALGLGPGGLGQGPGQAEVGHPQPPVLAEQQVGGLDVAVGEAPGMGVVEAPGGVEAHHQRLGDRQQPPGLEDALQAAALEVLGDQEGHPVAGPSRRRPGCWGG